MLDLRQPARGITLPQMRKFCVLLKEKQIPELTWRDELSQRFGKSSRTELTLLETIELIDWAEAWKEEQMTYDFDHAWQAPVEEKGKLPEDGEYYGVVGKAAEKVSRDGDAEWLVFSITVTEGVYSGKEVESLLYYISKGERREIGLDQIKKLADMVDPELRVKAPSFIMGLSLLCNGIVGRPVKFRQAKGFINILEVFEPTGPVAAADGLSADIAF